MAATQKSLCAIPADPIEFPADANTLDYARSEDAKCPIRHMREHFIFPTRASLKKKALDGRLPGVCKGKLHVANYFVSIQ
ncbi:Kynureninase (L-kynurenine hydrolase) [Pyricularia oryzae]|nr:Kynureninase (L-kynurenine hydrolase) [Pyricularia oryzae]